MKVKYTEIQEKLYEARRAEEEARRQVEEAALERFQELVNHAVEAIMEQREYDADRQRLMVTMITKNLANDVASLQSELLRANETRNSLRVL